jgi:hypothetical protein
MSSESIGAFVAFILVVLSFACLYALLELIDISKALNKLAFKFMSIFIGEIRLDFYHHANKFKRSYMINVYSGLVKPRRSQHLTAFEVFKLMRELKAIAADNNIDVESLANTLELLDTRGNLSINEVAVLIGAGLDSQQIIDKARRYYSFKEILETKDIPVKWSDEIYGKNYISRDSLGF